MIKYHAYIILGLCHVALGCNKVSNLTTNAGLQSNGNTTLPIEVASEFDQQFYDTTLYSVLDSAAGDLNLDAYPDKIIILKNKVEDIATSSCRPLLILTGLPDLSFKVMAQNDSIVLCNGCGGIYGDPYVDLMIEKGQFTIEHYGGSAWRWTRNITFQYSVNDDRWYLLKDGGISYHVSEPDSIEILMNNEDDYGKVLFENFNNKF